MAAASVEGVSNPASQARVLRVCLKSVESVESVLGECEHDRKRLKRCSQAVDPPSRIGTQPSFTFSVTSFKFQDQLLVISIATPVLGEANQEFQALLSDYSFRLNDR